MYKTGKLLKKLNSGIPGKIVYQFTSVGSSTSEKNPDFIKRIRIVKGLFVKESIKECITDFIKDF